MSGFFGFSIARLGMQAQQKALEVTAHNVANANTPGYSRQVARMAATMPVSYAGGRGALGTGVRVEEIARVRDEFLDMQIRGELRDKGRWQAASDVLNRIEHIFMEPTATGFNSVLNNFFSAWQELSLNPEGTPVRAALAETSSALTNAVRHINEQLKTVRSQIDMNVALKVTEINTLAAQIGDLNTQIVTMTAVNDLPGDLMDRRDLLADRLAELANITVSGNEHGSVNIFIGGRSLVRDGTVNNLMVEPSAGMVDGWLVSPRVVWERDGGAAAITGGEIAGLLRVRDVNLRGYMESFGSLAFGIVNAVNDIHSQGMDIYGNQGGAFFIGTHLENLQVRPELRDDLGRIAAALEPAAGFGTPNPGDGKNALRIAQLRHLSLAADPALPPENRLRLPLPGETGITTFEEYYKDFIARLGVDTHESNRMKENQQSMAEKMQQRKLSVSGVSLDEELANMIQFQLAYQASARMISAFDEILDTVINRIIR